MAFGAVYGRAPPPLGAGARARFGPRKSVRPGLDSVILGHVLPALVLEHHLGQFLALPELVEGYRATADKPLPSARRR